MKSFNEIYGEMIAIQNLEKARAEVNERAANRHSADMRQLSATVMEEAKVIASALVSVNNSPETVPVIKHDIWQQSEGQVSRRFFGSGRGSRKNARLKGVLQDFATEAWDLHTGWTETNWDNDTHDSMYTRFFLGVDGEVLASTNLYYKSDYERYGFYVVKEFYIGVNEARLDAVRKGIVRLSIESGLDLTQ